MERKNQIGRGRRAMFTLAATAAVLLSTVGAAPASAATLPTGIHGASWVACNGLYKGTVMTADAPHIEASIVDYSASNITNGAGANHVQLVGFRQSLVVWNPTAQAWHYSDQNLDGKRDSGPIYQAVVGNEFSYLMPTEWYNTAARRWETGTTPFVIRYKGHYRVWTEYIWYADAVSTGGSDGMYSAKHLTVNAYGSTEAAWCTY